MGLPEFVIYQESFRPAEDAATFRQEWIVKSMGEKQKWTRKQKAMVNHFDRVNPLQQALYTAADAFQQRYDAERVLGTLRTTRDLNHWVADVEVLGRSYDARHADWQAYVPLLQAFDAEERSHGGHSVNSLAETALELTTTWGVIRDNRKARLNLNGYLEKPPVARDALGQPRMPEHWLPPSRQRLRARFRKDVAAHKRNIHPGLQEADANQTWRAVPTFDGGGGQSKCVLWLKFDDSKMIEDRVLRKMVLMNEREWIDPTRWKGDVRSMATKEPLELAITQAMDDANFLHTVGLREATDITRHVDNRALTYTMYLEFMTKGDLHKFIRGYRDGNERIPEPFIFCVAEALALCCKVMAHGVLPNKNNTETPREDWMEIVHRDLKPGNVFLDDVDVNEDEDEGTPRKPKPLWPFFDRPVLGDYGFAVETHDGDELNPNWYKNRTGTVGFLPPEQSKHMNVETQQPIDEARLSEKTNIYGVGLVLWCMVTNTTHPPEPAWLGIPADDTTFDLPHAQFGHWSSQLRGIIRDCLVYDPALRPTVDQLLSRIALAVREDGPNLGWNMRSGSAMAGVRAMYMPQFLEQKYAYSMSADDAGIEI